MCIIYGCRRHFSRMRSNTINQFHRQFPDNNHHQRSNKKFNQFRIKYLFQCFII